MSHAINAAPLWTITPDPSLQVNSTALSDDGSCCVFGTSSEYGSGQFGVYCYNGAGQLRWSLPFGEAGSTQGVFWVAASADGQFAAAGGETGKTAGLLTAYRVADGVQVLNLPTAYRINQVALSGDGSLLLAVLNDTVQLYRYAQGAYTLSSQHSFPLGYCNSCALSPDGFNAVVSCTFYNDQDPSKNSGRVISLTVAGGQLSVAGSWTSPVGTMRVAIAATGRYWGASLHDGSCVLFNPANTNAPLWRYQPEVANLGVAYGFAITHTTDGRVLLACGTNLYVDAPQDSGYLYLVASIASGTGQAPQLCWGATLSYSANPGVSLDREGCFVTATDGKPASGSDPQPGESPGNFYLFDAGAGTLLWRYATPLMNWPMTITPDASRVFGGSDDGSVYCWGQSAP
jgi:hypothetical protein